jgi:hypothetical protein
LERFRWCQTSGIATKPDNPPAISIEFCIRKHRRYAGLRTRDGAIANAPKLHDAVLQRVITHKAVTWRRA